MLQTLFPFSIKFNLLFIFKENIMSKRKIIKIDEDKCNGCGLCIPNCPEGAIQLIDNKARIISDLFCDGLGACIGHCPEGAITIEEREAEPYDEKKVMENIIKKGKNTIIAHLEHLKDHEETENLNIANQVLKEKSINIELKDKNPQMHIRSGCPGSRVMDFSENNSNKESEIINNSGNRPSQLKQWPIQLHLVPPHAPYYQGKDVLLAADCVAYAMGDFHKDYMKNKSIAIACPKLDDGLDVYIEKIKLMIDNAKINSLTVMMMEVPCCFGLMQIVKEAVKKANRKIPVRSIIVSLQGEILQENEETLNESDKSMSGIR